MAKMDAFKDAKAPFLPKRTYKDELTVGSGRDQIDLIINGHIPVGTWNDLRDYADFTRDFVAFAEQSLKAGKSVDQAAAEYKVDPKYKGYVASVNPAFGGPRANLQIAYDELKKK
jgi:hypothetical protein